MLKYAQEQEREAERDVERARNQLASAESSFRHWNHAAQEHLWQLHQREKAEEVNGL
jgi:hypothetical protein